MKEAQKMKQHTYIAIDLKSFYASVECRERGLDPLDTNLVVADESRTDKTICLAVTPSLKSYGISGRGRLFEVKQRVKEANAGRQHDAPGHRLDGTSHFFSELQANPSLAIDFIIAPPRMACYMEYSTRVYQVYLKYIAPEDIVVYSIDEVFMDVTDYLNTYKLSAHDLAMKIILDVLETTGITATAGIGTNLFLCKVAMDIVAKHIPADKNGVRIAELDEMKFRRELWSHQPLTDFWRVGRGIAKKLAMSPSVQSGTRTCFTSCLARMRNCSLTMRGDGNRPPLKQSRRTVPAPTASAPVRYCTVPMSRRRRSWLCGK
jgi:DNA polymerase V